MPLQAGDKFPEDVHFEWAPITDEDPTACGIPQDLNASKEWKGKKVVLVSVPDQGVDLVAVIASNDAWVMNAWGKVNHVPKDDIIMLSDTKTKFSEKYGWPAGMGDRNGRWAMIIEKDGSISYAENEKSPREVTVSGADAVLSRL
ncbi:hypothetical protein H2203_006104 [Taxawa tesnikishii (nom. ined.)]|nr:hypothetical protein H2203_006104 [Dothideales sp. JES 119]